MRVFGTVKDTRTEVPIKGAKVSLSIAEKELAVLYTDSKGKFEHSVTESYIGETLTFYAEKKGYKSQSSTYKIEGEEIPFDIELVPIVVESLWEKLKRWFVENKKWIAIGAGIIVVAIIVYKMRPLPHGDDSEQSIVLLPMPRQISPANGQVLQTSGQSSEKIELIWDTVPGAASYEVQLEFTVGENEWSDPRTIPTHKTSYVVSFSHTWLPIRWRVWAIDSTGREGYKTDWWTFDVR